MNQPVEEEELRHIFDAIAKLPPVQLELQIAPAFIIFSQIQLALRHPLNNGAPAQKAKDFALYLQELFRSASPRLGEIAEMGWHPKHDIGVSPWPDKEPDKETITAFEEELLINSLALGIAIQALAKKSNMELNYWADLLTNKAQEQYESMSAEARKNFLKAIKDLRLTS